MERNESTVLFTHILTNPIDGKEFSIQNYISGDHDQDCCEKVYIDFEHVESQRDELIRLGFIKKLEIVTAPGDGFIVNLYNGENDGISDKRVSIFLACRNCQNGMYNDKLVLEVNIEQVRFSQELQEIGLVLNETP